MIQVGPWLRWLPAVTATPVRGHVVIKALLSGPSDFGLATVGCGFTPPPRVCDCHGRRVATRALHCDHERLKLPSPRVEGELIM